MRERAWRGSVVLLPSSRFLNIPSDLPHIHLVIKPPLAAGLSECCRSCPPGTLLAVSLGEAAAELRYNALPEGVIVPGNRNLFLKIVPFLSISDCDLRYLSD